jgi:hypothetical protein
VDLKNSVQRIATTDIAIAWIQKDLQNVQINSESRDTKWHSTPFPMSQASNGFVHSQSGETRSTGHCSATDPKAQELANITEKHLYGSQMTLWQYPLKSY